MTYTIHDPSLVYDAIITRLASQTGKNIGRAEAPDLGDWPYEPYAVVYPTDDPNMGTLGDQSEIAVYEFQVTCGAGTPQAAEWMQTQVRTAILGWTPTVAGRSFNPIAKAGGQGTSRDDDVQPPVFFTVDVFQLFAS